MDQDPEKASTLAAAPSSPNSTAAADDHTMFEPLRTANTNTSNSGNSNLDLTVTRTHNSSKGLDRTRSQNGYGVGDESDEADESAQQQTPEKDPYEVGWENGDNDPLCPRRFNKARKWLIVLITAGGSLTVTCASSIYTSTYTKMEAEFHNSREISILGLSIEFYGRRPIYIASWTMYLIWIIPQAVAQNVATVIVSRFLDGLSGSAFLAVSGGTVGDLFARHELQAPMAAFSIAPFIGPSVGPLIGGFINYYADWRWTYYVLLIWAGVMWFAIVLLVPETYHPILLRNKACQIRKETGDDRWIAPVEKSQKTVVQAISISLMRPFQLLFSEPMLLNLCIFSAILLGILYLFFGAFPLVFRTNHGFNQWQIGLTFIGIGFGMVVAVMADPLWYRIRAKLIAKLSEETGVPGSSQPEFRLPPAILGAVLVPVGIFMFGWTTYASVHWIAPIIGSAIFGAGNLMVFTGIFTFLVDSYPQYAASALAANAFVRCSFAGKPIIAFFTPAASKLCIPLFGNQMYEKLGYQWASSLLAFLTVVMMPFPYIFFKYGRKIRGKSRFAAD
ncbi:Efflux pump atB [Cladobotryum mycophilum]|uniref:Efflux pump atB n=1 Tax=Cladobotryum mycophilum TaxID=491253 RepID=A0ABR0SSS3_9HYPO